MRNCGRTGLQCLVDGHYVSEGRANVAEPVCEGFGREIETAGAEQGGVVVSSTGSRGRPVVIHKHTRQQHEGRAGQKDNQARRRSSDEWFAAVVNTLEPPSTCRAFKSKSRYDEACRHHRSGLSTREC